MRNEANLNATAVKTINLTTFVDGDGDGMSDAWEGTYGLNAGSSADRDIDSDGDGMSNYAEYVAGTDPRDNLSYLKITGITAAGSATLTFGAVSNKTYTIQYSDNLNAVSWLRLSDVVSRATNYTGTIVDSAWATNRFYRVTTPRLP